mmetsp:Transcript_4851/g.7501  ORF Transcript_4851/g.7501 Transcript_4851/m.7501 type:complete len:159 (-) Transcript_4851:192-668(-)
MKRTIGLLFVFLTVVLINVRTTGALSALLLTRGKLVASAFATGAGIILTPPSGDEYDSVVAKATASPSSNRISTSPGTYYSPSSLILSENSNESNDNNSMTEEQRQEILERMRARRQLMEASRTSNNRQSYLDLSRQRAALYNTTSRAVSCPPNIPCY